MLATFHWVAAIIGAGVVVVAGIEDAGCRPEGGPASPLAVTLIDGAVRGIDQTAMTHDLEVTLRVAAVTGHIGTGIAVFSRIDEAVAAKRAAATIAAAARVEELAEARAGVGKVAESMRDEAVAGCGVAEQQHLAATAACR